MLLLNHLLFCFFFSVPMFERGVMNSWRSFRLRRCLKKEDPSLRTPLPNVSNNPHCLPAKSRLKVPPAATQNANLKIQSRKPRLRRNLPPVSLTRLALAPVARKQQHSFWRSRAASPGISFVSLALLATPVEV